MKDAFLKHKEHSTIEDLMSKSMVSHGGLFSNNLRNLHGKSLKVATFDYAPFTTGRPASPGEQPQFDGIEVCAIHFYHLSP